MEERDQGRCWSAVIPEGLLLLLLSARMDAMSEEHRKPGNVRNDDATVSPPGPPGRNIAFLANSWSPVRLVLDI